MHTLIILNFIYFSLFTLFIFQIGNFFSSKLKNKTLIKYKSLNFLFGIFLIGSIIVIINFFFPTGSNVTYIILLIVFFFSYKSITPIKYIFKIILINLLVYPICLKMTFAYDAGLYHLGYMNALRTEKIVFGLANIQGYGFSSFQDYLGSIVFTPNFIFHKFIIGSFLSFFCLFLDDCRKTKTYFDKIFFYSVLLSIPLLSRYLMVYTTLTDTATGILLVVQFYFALKIFLLSKINKDQNLENIQIFIVLTFLCVAFKGSAVLAAVLFFAITYFTVKSFEILKLIILKNVFLFFLIFCWLLKNIVISGCFVFPITISCFDFFDWNASATAKEMSTSAMAWHRQPYAGREPLLNNNWFFEYWIKTYDTLILSILFLIFLIFILNFILVFFKDKKKIMNFMYFIVFFIPLILFQNETLPYIQNFLNLNLIIIFASVFLFFCLTFIYYYRKVIMKNISKNFKFILIFLSYLLISVSLWFYNAPSPRFAFGYFFCLLTYFGFVMHIILNGSELIFSYSDSFRKINLFFLYFFIIIIFSQSERTSTRYSVYNFFNNSFWTKKLVNNYEFELNIPFDGNDVEVIKRENYGFKPKYGQCWLVRDCYVGLDLKEYSMPLNYRKLKLTGNN